MIFLCFFMQIYPNIVAFTPCNRTLGFRHLRKSNLVPDWTFDD